MPLGANDLQKLMEVEREAFDEPWSASIMRDSIHAAHSRVWGIYSELNDLIGFGVISIVLEDAEIIDMAVSEAYQGKGYGKILMRFLLDKARQNGAENMFLEVGVKNDTAISLYKNLGFEQINLRKDYYLRKNNILEDALVLKFEL